MTLKYRRGVAACRPRRLSRLPIHCGWCGWRNHARGSRGRPGSRAPARAVAHLRSPDGGGPGRCRDRRPRPQVGVLLGPARPGGDVRGKPSRGRPTNQRGPRRSPAGGEPAARGAGTGPRGRASGGGPDRRHVAGPAGPPRITSSPHCHARPHRGHLHEHGLPGRRGTGGRDRLVQLPGSEHPPRPSGSNREGLGVPGRSGPS